ncbi:monovalent cation/H(+) antiporter subunit G [Coxiella burnetii]|uniref:Sodium/proton antiporter protein n=1 Tax=Coxiella burnetii (strain RSA 493 / Nine Mile phase I) TaxID=227377 RepID=Q83BC9_COXBU|nr:monovalent cation/H(+) antiporter subunit G [Coxiella burnetii]NP_820565.1 sodium/proton antiporter protein [Coxiella burnetii RSA 493]AAO91079.1 sodium/proton antiporter protein [Coxiella burnetii RSA 493]ABX78185.1 Na(+)/H(+) antiporter subunit G [Coxiella burnetii RSA 331]ACJ17857.1 sodium/proton antiporter protein [Coxiella burnetii CbuG_Q212]AML48517.1 sodium:proton antiporter [Coxiella burnetii]AML54515.1 sodium:proton antiporter [Coxiella burnetii]
MIKEWLTIFFVFVGTLFIFIASVGILRMPDLLTRMHAATKAGSLGVGLVLGGVAIYFGTWTVTIEAVVIVWFIVMTAPIASHLIARASYFDNIKLTKATFIDELQPHYDQRTYRLKSALEERRKRS